MRASSNKADLTGSPISPPHPPFLVDPLRLEALDNNNNQPATGATKAGGGWQESVNKAITQPWQWTMMNNKSMRRMMMAATTRVRVSRVMVTAMRLAGNKEGQGNKEDDGVDNEGSVQQRGRW